MAYLHEGLWKQLIRFLNNSSSVSMSFFTLTIFTIIGPFFCALTTFLRSWIKDEGRFVLKKEKEEDKIINYLSDL